MRSALSVQDKKAGNRRQVVRLTSTEAEGDRAEPLANVGQLMPPIQQQPTRADIGARLISLDASSAFLTSCVLTFAGSSMIIIIIEVVVRSLIKH